MVDGYTFLEQTSWNNFNEDYDLQAAVEDCHRRFGVYPQAVLSDRIYQISYCAELAPLGYKWADTERREQRQMLQDSGECNTIKGYNGNLKHKFSLGLIYCKLDENVKTEAALNILAMNATYRLCRWLMQFGNFFRINFVFQ